MNSRFFYIKKVFPVIMFQEEIKYCAIHFNHEQYLIRDVVFSINDVQVVHKIIYDCCLL